MQAATKLGPLSIRSGETLRSLTRGFSSRAKEAFRGAAYLDDLVDQARVHKDSLYEAADELLEVYSDPQSPFATLAATRVHQVVANYIYDFCAGRENIEPVTTALDNDLIFQADGSLATEYQTAVAQARLTRTAQESEPTFKITVGDLAEEYRSWDPDQGKIRSDYLVTDRVMGLIKDLYPNGLKGLNVLVPGCGTGEFEIWLAKQGAHVDAFDLLPIQAERAQAKLRATQDKELIERVNFQVGDITNLSFLPEGKKYDLVITLMIHLYLNDERFAKSFEEIAKRMNIEANGIYANDFPPRYAPYLTGGRNPFAVDGSTNSISFQNSNPSLFDTLFIEERYPKDNGTEWQTKFIIEPIHYVLNCMSDFGLRINEIIVPKPTDDELRTLPEMMVGADVIPPYMIVHYIKQA